jgi:hypothetical protein
MHLRLSTATFRNVAGNASKDTLALKVQSQLTPVGITGHSTRPLKLSTSNKCLIKILDRSKWPKGTDPCFGDKQVRELAKEFNVCVSSSVIDSVNTLSVGTVTTFLLNFSHL